MARSTGMAPGLKPITDGPMVEAVSHQLKEIADRQGPKPTSMGTRHRASDARSCDRRRALKALGFEPDREDDWKTRMAFETGGIIHARLQSAVLHRYRGEVERGRTWRPVADISGDADGDIDLDGDGDVETVLEIKTMAPYGWEQATGTAWNQREIPGPKPEHLTQAGLYALAPSLEVPRRQLWVVYVNKGSAAVAEWTIGVDDPLPHITGEPSVRDLVNAEVKRVNEIDEQLDADTLPGRCAGDGKPIDDPMQTRFPCGYCAWQTTCAALPTGPVRLGHVIDRKPNAAEDFPW